MTSSPSNVISQLATQSNNRLSLLSNQNLPAQNYQKHAITPHQSGAYNISSTLPNSSLGSHRTIPRIMPSTGSLRLPREQSTQRPTAPCFEKPFAITDNGISNEHRSPRSKKATSVIPSSVPSTLSSGEAAVRTNAFYDSSSTKDTSVTLAKAIDTKTTTQSSTAHNYKVRLFMYSPFLRKVNLFI